jgi:hypothetical protein
MTVNYKYKIMSNEAVLVHFKHPVTDMADYGKDDDKPQACIKSNTFYGCMSNHQHFRKLCSSCSSFLKTEENHKKVNQDRWDQSIIF